MLTQFTTRAGSLFTPAKSHSEFNHGDVMSHSTQMYQVRTKPPDSYWHAAKSTDHWSPLTGDGVFLSPQRALLYYIQPCHRRKPWKERKVLRRCDSVDCMMSLSTRFTVTLDELATQVNKISKYQSTQVRRHPHSTTADPWATTSI